ncbi:MAG: hypothetical protein M3092_04520 [Actinomycetia bacterium]|nr:hypothetical protein [Actinomycetes bacterium]
MKNREQLLAANARDQQGIFTLAQATACGFPERTIEHRTASGMFEAIYPGVYGYPGSAVSWEREVMAAVLSTSPLVAASHKTAAYLWGMTSNRPRGIEIVTTRHSRTKRSDFMVHESTDLRVSDIVSVDGIPITSATRTVVDLGASAPVWFVQRCLDTALRKQMFTAWEARCFIARVARPGRNGIGTIRPLIEERLQWQGLTESDLEDIFRVLVASSEVPMPEPQFLVNDDGGVEVGRFDFAYPEKMVLIETDSEGFHMDPVSFHRDREKQNKAQLLGWTVYRFTWRQIVDAPEEVLRTLRAIHA